MEQQAAHFRQEQSIYMEYHKMKPQIKEYNCETGIEIVRDATDEEILQIQLDAEYSAKLKLEIETKAKAKADLLSKLGISEEEAQLLLS